MAGKLSKPVGLVGAIESGLKFGQDRVYLSELRHLSKQAVACDELTMGADGKTQVKQGSPSLGTPQPDLRLM